MQILSAIVTLNRTHPSLLQLFGSPGHRLNAVGELCCNISDISSLKGIALQMRQEHYLSCRRKSLFADCRRISQPSLRQHRPHEWQVGLLSGDNEACSIGNQHTPSHHVNVFQHENHLCSNDFTYLIHTLDQRGAIGKFIGNHKHVFLPIDEAFHKQISRFQIIWQGDFSPFIIRNLAPDAQHRMQVICRSVNEFMPIILHNQHSINKCKDTKTFLIHSGFTKLFFILPNKGKSYIHQVKH